MVLRLVTIVIAFLALERAADACCLGCPCTKYKDQQPEREFTIQETAPGYTRSIRGAVPAWNLARVTKFLTTGLWKPLRTPAPPGVRPARPSNVRIIPAPAIRFTTADKVDEPSELVAQVVLIRRIEKHGSAILVEVDDRTFKLAACPGKPGTACLVDPGKLALRPIPPPGGSPAPGSGSGFAQPPP